MKDRVPSKPGRYRIEFEGDLGTQYGVLHLDDEPLVEGDVLNKETLLSDQAATFVGLDSEAVPTDAFVKLKTLQDSTNEALNNNVENINTKIDTIPWIQYGTVPLQLTGGVWGDFTVTFPEAFPVNIIPTVVFTPLHNSGISYIYYKTLTKSNTQFTGRVNSSGSGQHQINWIAIGQKPKEVTK